MCNHHERITWECRGDGYLWDADHDGWDPEDISFPCPKCNTKEYLHSNLEYIKEQDCGGYLDADTRSELLKYVQSVSSDNIKTIIEELISENP